MAQCSKLLRFKFALWRVMTVTPVASYNPEHARPVSLARGRFRHAPFRSPLLWGRSYFLRVLRCFSSPGSLRYRGTIARMVGCPIRRWWDQCPLAAPPPLSQRCHVLRRHPAPRHPPSAHHVFPDQARGRVEHASRPGRFHASRVWSSPGTVFSIAVLQVGKVRTETTPPEQESCPRVWSQRPSPLNRGDVCAWGTQVFENASLRWVGFVGCEQPNSLERR